MHELNLELELKKYCDENVLSSLSNFLDGERKTSHVILLHLAEIESRKIYAKRGFDSLFRLLVVHFKLSESSAYRRIQAMRMLKQVPKAQESLVTGEVNLTTLAMAQTQIRREEKRTGQKVSTQRKTTIVESLKNKTQADAEVELFRLLPETVSSPRTQEKRISETETRIGLNVPDDVLDMLKRLRELWSHAESNMDYVEIIRRCARDVLKRADPNLKPTRPLNVDSTFKSANEPKSMKQSNTAPQVRKDTGKRSSYISVQVKRKIHQEANSCCVWVDPLTGRRCQSKFFLQIDHIAPIWAGGANEPENYQLLCGTHNRLKYELETNKTLLGNRV